MSKPGWANDIYEQQGYVVAELDRTLADIVSIRTLLSTMKLLEIDWCVLYHSKSILEGKTYVFNTRTTGN